MDKVNKLMKGMGFPETENGPYVSELRIKLKESFPHATYMSPGTWSREGLTYEQKAKAFLSMLWALENDRSYESKVIDPIFTKTYNIRTRKYRYVIRWNKIWPWLGDRKRQFICWLHCTLGPRNPYR